MKYIFLVVAAFLTALLFFEFGKKKRVPNVDYDTCMDGGVKKSTDANAPKYIVSDEIVDFYCEVSTLSLWLPSFELSGFHFKFKAIPGDDNAVHCEYQKLSRFPHDEQIVKSFDTDASFMMELQKLVRQFDFAKHNGKFVFVHGLPDMFGAIVNIKYASGEWIYTKNNQDCFIQTDAIAALNELFCKQIDKM